MSPLNRDKFRLSRLDVQGQVFQIPAPAQGLLPGELPPQVPQSLSAAVIARIYSDLASTGFSALQQVPGGAQLASDDGFAVLVVATFWLAPPRRRAGGRQPPEGSAASTSGA